MIVYACNESKARAEPGCSSAFVVPKSAEVTAAELVEFINGLPEVVETVLAREVAVVGSASFPSNTVETVAGSTEVAGESESVVLAGRSVKPS